MSLATEAAVSAVVAVLRAILPVAFVLVAVVIAWFLFWKFVLEPNPLVRDFFDLEKKPVPPKNDQRVHSKKQTKMQ